MWQPGGLFYLFITIIIILASLGTGFFCIQNVMASESILISEAQLTGGSGKTGNDFIELYNPNDSLVNLKGYRLVKRTKTGATDTSIKSWTTDTFIPASGYYLWANSGYTDIATVPNATTTATISDDNGIALRFGASDTGAIIDSLAWGEAQNIFIEGAVFPSNPGANQSLARRLNSDTNNNSADFFIEDYPNPQSSALADTPPPAAQCGNGQVETGESCDDGNLANGDGCSSTCQTEMNLTPPSPSPGEGDNTATSTSTANNPPNPPLQGGQIQGGQRINFGEVVINELVSDPADNEVEWLELYNKTSQEINLSGWWIEDGSKAKTKLEGMVGAGDSDRYMIIEKPAGNLNNGGDMIMLYDLTGKIIDQAVYGDWNDGNLADNAPVAHDPASLARKFDGYNSFNNANDFSATIKPTKGASNIIQAEDEISAEAKARFDFSNDIHLSEILPNPTGDDTKLEFIEIYNASAREVNLTGWSLSNEDNKKVNLEKAATSTIIRAGEYLAIFRPKTKIVLHNDQGEVKLFQPLADKPFMIVAYKNVREGWSYSLNNAITPPARLASESVAGRLNPPLSGGKIDGEWLWSETPTPGQANIIKQVNQVPEVEFSFKSPAAVGRPVIFDSSDTEDMDGDSLKFSWDFSDGFKSSLANPEHTFFKSGIYQVKLAVSDDKATTTEIKSIKVVNSVGDFGGADKIEVNGETPLAPLLKGGESGVIINEIFSDPAGADTGKEWLELKNQGQARVNLINWQAENENGKYKFKNDLWLDAANFYLLTNTVSKLAFKNSADIVSLYNNLNELADSVEYANAVQGEAYARGANGKWFWTTAITPARENIINLSDSQSVVLTKTSSVSDDSLNYVETTLEKIKELEIGSLVKVNGLVAVEPGILGAQIFYLASLPARLAEDSAKRAGQAVSPPSAASSSFASADAKATADKSAGIQIYNYKKDFPALKIGDYIEVKGELAEAQDEFRIKTKDKSNIKVVEHKLPPLALALSCDAVSEENIGQLITVTGEITDKKAATAYLDDGNDEILVYFKQSAGLDTKSFKAGQTVAITGILSKTQTGLRLLPRYQTDLVKINETRAEPQVLGVTIQSEEWAVVERDKKLELFKYLLIIACGIIIILGILFVKVRRKK